MISQWRRVLRGRGVNEGLAFRGFQALHRQPLGRSFGWKAKSAIWELRRLQDPAPVSKCPRLKESVQACRRFPDLCHVFVWRPCDLKIFKESMKRIQYKESFVSAIQFCAFTDKWRLCVSNEVARWHLHVSDEAVEFTP